MTATYNGWTNYETWNVALWIDNDEPSYLYWRARSRQTLADYPPHDRAFCYADLLGAALSEVCWLEIAEHLIGE